MIVCPVCAFRNVGSQVRCLKCQALLREDEVEVADALARADELTRREFAAGAFKGLLHRLRSRNPLRALWALPEHVRYRFPFTAGLLSLVPGLGQVYNRQPGKGFLFAGLWWSGAAVCLVTLRHPWSNVLLLLLLLGWLLIWSDAVASAVRINGGLWSFRNSVALWFAAMFLAGVTISGAQFFGMNLVSLVRVLDSSQEPHIRSGELVLTNHMAYWFSEPKLGEVVYFDPGRFTAEFPGALASASMSINIKDYFQRVSGLPGDRIEKREGRLYRNGALVPPELEPFGLELIPDGESFTVPKGRYWLPVTSIPSDFFAVALFDASSPSLSAPGWIFKGWREACLISREELRGRAAAVLDPPGQRRFLGAK